MNGSYYQNPTFPNNDIIIKDDIIILNKVILKTF